MDPKAIINDIRKKLLVDVELPPDLREGVNELKEQLNNALDHLSRDLYSTDAHFLLELIQNADDNSYAHGLVPTVKFIVNDRHVVLENNESGFTEPNVRSLCKVGESTKRKRDGFIGEKGLGFKSVFRITNEPHVFSNGFSFKFKFEESKDGYVVPHWVEKPTIQPTVGMTTIYLPLKAGIDVAPYFVSINGTLILFLQKLRTITVSVESAPVREISKSRENGITTVRDSAPREESKYVVTSRTASVPADITEQTRTGVTLREIVLAFPLDDFGAVSASEQTLFAYLPVRPYGFKFIIQSDFLLAANREDVRKDAKWNEWLRNEIAATFCQSPQWFKLHETVRSGYLQYVPLPDEVTDPFFKKVVPQIYKSLEQTECLLSVAGTWLLPSKLLRGSKEISQIIPNEELKRIVGSEYLAPEHASAPAAVLEAIGCKCLLLEHVYTCLADDSWFRERPISWYRSLFRWMARRFKSESVDQLRKLKILPLAGGSTARPADGQVFFPTDLNTDFAFESSLHVLNPELFKRISKEENVELRAFLAKLGVKVPSAYQIIESHILPQYQSGEYAKLPASILRDHIRYIKQHFPEYQKGVVD